MAMYFKCVYTTRICFFFFFHDPATTEIYTLSLHDALPILSEGSGNTASTCCSWLAVAEAVALRASCKDRKSTRLNSSHVEISYAVFCLKKKKKTTKRRNAPDEATRSRVGQSAMSWTTSGDT